MNLLLLYRLGRATSLHTPSCRVYLICHVWDRLILFRLLNYLSLLLTLVLLKVVLKSLLILVVDRLRPVGEKGLVGLLELLDQHIGLT